MATRRSKAKEAAALARAMTLIGRGWTQGAFCRDRSGTAVMPGSPKIHRMDLAYALAQAAREYGLHEDHLRVLVTLRLAAPYCNDPHFGLERWNDVPFRTRTEVVLVLERTIGGL